VSFKSAINARDYAGEAVGADAGHASASAKPGILPANHVERADTKSSSSAPSSVSTVRRSCAATVWRAATSKRKSDGQLRQSKQLRDGLGDIGSERLLDRMRTKKIEGMTPSF
jgi:hypothetical protein